MSTYDNAYIRNVKERATRGVSSLPLAYLDPTTTPPSSICVLAAWFKFKTLFSQYFMETQPVLTLLDLQSGLFLSIFIRFSGLLGLIGPLTGLIFTGAGDGLAEHMMNQM